MRKYVRHEAGVPIEILDIDSRSSLGRPLLHNVSLGGLECGCQNSYVVGTLVLVRINILKPQYEVEGKVVWCQESDSQHLSGIQFFGAMDASRLRMVEQISHIEHYRKEVQQEEGRHLTGTEAANEWMALYGENIP